MEFGKSLSDRDVHILDPFVGTGNFVVRVMQEIKKTALPYKYANELHCNEVMLLPYYIASMNIEHAYLEATGEYKPFDGICLVDTFELEEKQQDSLFTAENTARVKKQKQTPIFVVIGNPPYNAWQESENDNNKNRKYKFLDSRIKETYGHASTATNKNNLLDPYIRAIRWATDRIGSEGVVCLVTNNGFLESIAADGMRKCLLDDFDSIYILDLGGNVRKNPKLSGTTNNVFGIKVGVSINILVCKKGFQSSRLRYARTDEFWTRTQKEIYLAHHSDLTRIRWTQLSPRNGVWLTEGIESSFEKFAPIGNKYERATSFEQAESIFFSFSGGIKTSRDAWAINFDLEL